MKAALLAAAFVILCTTATAEEAERQSLTWGNFPPANFPKMPTRVGSTERAKQRAYERYAKAREKAVEPLLGLRFYGLCEVVSVKPDKVRGFVVRVIQCNDILAPDDGVQMDWVDGRWVQRYATWKTTEREALNLTPSQRFNIAGDIKDVEVRGGVSLFSGATKGGKDEVVTIHLENVTY